MEYVALTYKLISLKQLTLICMENAKDSLTTMNPIARTSSKSCEDWTEQIFSIDQGINDFFPLRLPSCNSSKHAKHV